MWTRLVVFIVGLCFYSVAFAQLDAPTLSFSYNNTELDDVILDLEKRYDLHFTYSQLPLDLGITAHVTREHLQPAIDNLFNGSPIKHAFISDQIVLRADRGMLAQLETKKIKPQQKSPIYQEKKHRPATAITHPIPTWKSTEIIPNERLSTEQQNREELAKMAEISEQNERHLAMQEYGATHRLAQISLLPYLGTNAHRSKDVTNKISINIFWGQSRAINGFEIGGIANSVIEDMTGFQMAGVLNQVGGDMTGTQIAGFINHVGGKVDGFQMAAIGNIGLDSVKGAQLSTLFNVGKYHVEGTQLAGLFNWAEGNVRRQQSFLFNRAEKVEKRQIGLFNFCDTTAKAPIGLLNFVKHGYNRFEVGGSQEMFVQIGGKLGTHKLYNILLLGLRWDHIKRMQDGQMINGNFTSWSLGYGLGKANRLGKKGILNTELTLSHVNELENWTSQLNLLGQFKLTFDYRVSKRFSFYAGPTLNVMWSDLYDPFSDRYGSIISRDDLWNRQTGSTNSQGWIGFTAGVRI